MEVIDRLGFDAVNAGPLEAGPALEPDGSVFGVSHRAHRRRRHNIDSANRFVASRARAVGPSPPGGQR
jgi:predicted dinucleotide-binding enzyme